MSNNLKDILREFDALYKKKAPLRHARLRKGLTKEQVKKLEPKLHVDSLPEDYITL